MTPSAIQKAAEGAQANHRAISKHQFGIFVQATCERWIYNLLLRVTKNTILVLFSIVQRKPFLIWFPVFFGHFLQWRISSFLLMSLTCWKREVPSNTAAFRSDWDRSNSNLALLKLVTEQRFDYNWYQFDYDIIKMLSLQLCCIAVLSM